MIIQRIFYILRAIRISGIIRTIQYARYRDKVEKRFILPRLQPIKISPGKLVDIKPIEGGAQLVFNNAQVELLFVTKHILRVSWSPGKAPVPYTISSKNREIQNPAIEHLNTSLRLSLDKYEVLVDDEGRLTIGEINGNILRKDNPPVCIGESWNLSTNLSPDEHIYGLGERASNLNLRPGEYNSWNTDIGGRYSKGDDPLYIGTPIFLSLSKTGTYITYFENSFPATFTIGDVLQASFSGGMLRYYVILGALETLYSELGELIGYPCMPPRWVFGYHQSRWGYKSEEDIKEIINGFKKYDLPLSAIHLDIDYMDGFRVFTVDKQRFPSLKRLSSELDEVGIKLVASINPAVKIDRNYRLYEDGLSHDIFCKLPDGATFTGVSWPGWSVFPDFTKPETREWWQGQYASLLNEGISGIWHDMNEPASFAAWGEKTFPLNVNHSMEGVSGYHIEAHNLYGLLMTQAAFAGIQNYNHNKRPWLFSRAGWAGLQKYAWNWTGDIESSWEALQQTVSTILGLGLSGHIFSGVDIGGFSGDPDAELYIRWFQMASFFPLFRTHSAVGTGHREPWSYGESATNNIRSFLKLRYRLIPYFYSEAWKSTKIGIPFIRPVFWDNPQIRSFWDIDDEFLVGSSLLVAPILEKNIQTRIIHLPRGEWYSFWDDRVYQGLSEFEVSTNLDQIPLFIKAGSLLPMVENNKFTLHIYPLSVGEANNSIYLDSGDGYGDWRLDNFIIASSENAVDISWKKQGRYEFPFSQLEINFHGNTINKALIDHTILDFEDNLLRSPIFNNLKIFLDG